MEDKIVLITGCTDGIGKQVALELAQMGAVILIHGRKPKRVRQAINEICRVTGNSKLEPFVADFSCLDRVRDLAAAIKQKHDRLDVLINNAGVYEKSFRLSRDGHEMTFAVNHLAPFLLTLLLLEPLKKSPQGRIINISSTAHFNSPDLDFDNLNMKKRYNGYAAYAQSKLCSVFFTYELAERLAGTAITVNCLHPGAIDTKLLKAGFNMDGASVQQGAKTPVYLAAEPELENFTGRFFNDRQEAASSVYSYDAETRKQLWQTSLKLTGLETERLF